MSVSSVFNGMALDTTRLPDKEELKSPIFLCPMLAEGHLFLGVLQVGTHVAYSLCKSLEI